MYQRKSKLQTLLILSADCVCIFVSLILANYIRNKRLFERWICMQIGFCMLL